MLVLTHRDTLNTTFGEDDALSFKDIKSKNNPYFDDTRKGQTSSGGNQKDPAVRKKPAPRVKGSDRTMKEESPAFKETRAALVSAGSKTITVTSAVSPAEAVSLKSAKPQAETPASSGGLNQNQGKHKESRGLARGRPSEDTKEKNQEDLISTSNLVTILEQEQAHCSFAGSVQSPGSSATVLARRPIITAWEAGWNVTNAIQV